MYSEVIAALLCDLHVQEMYQAARSPCPPFLSYIYTNIVKDTTSIVLIPRDVEQRTKGKC